MGRLFQMDGFRDMWAIELRPGVQLGVVNAPLPREIGRHARIERVHQGQNLLLTFTTASLAVVDGLFDGRDLPVCRRLHFVRFAREGEDHAQVRMPKLKPRPRLREALVRTENDSMVQAIGGWDRVLVYKDEVAVPRYSAQESAGWIVLRDNIQTLLQKAQPPSKEHLAELQKKFAA